MQQKTVILKIPLAIRTASAALFVAQDPWVDPTFRALISLGPDHTAELIVPQEAIEECQDIFEVKP